MLLSILFNAISIQVSHYFDVLRCCPGIVASHLVINYKYSFTSKVKCEATKKKTSK